MKLILMILIIVLPFIMFFVQHRSSVFVKVFDIIALFSTVIFAIIAATSIYQIIKDDTVFTTAIHAIFLNKMFLIVGSYLLVFTIYKFVVLVVHDK